MTPRPRRAADIVSRVKISEVYRVACSVEPRRTGRDTWRARATWRDGDGWNVALDDSRGVWHDFVTDEGGGILALIQTACGCSKADALRWLADLTGTPLDDRPHSPAERATFARERAAVERDLPEAQLWRRAAAATAEDLLHGLKSALFDPMAEWPDTNEIRNLESTLSGLRRLDGAALVTEYRWWQTQCPLHVRGMVEAMRRRNRAERRALLAFLGATEPREAEAA